MDGEELPVPATSIYTRTDGVVRWWQCLESTGTATREHRGATAATGPGLQPGGDLWRSVIVSRSAPDEWKPFRPHVGGRPLFPRPANWDDHRTDAA